MNTLEKNLSSDIFQTAWLTYLVKDYGINAHWLLTGDGNNIIIYSNPLQNEKHKCPEKGNPFPS